MILPIRVSHRNRRIFWSAILLILPILLSGCKDEPIRLGFVATLSGRYSQLGVSCRNGFLMAVDEFNEAGGVSGRSIETVIGNDLGDPEVCAQLMQSQFDSGIIAVVGPLTSNMEPAIRKVASPDSLVISPTVSTDKLTGLDDHFIRFIPHTGIHGQIAAEMMKRLEIRTVSILFDLSNSQYSEEVMASFRDYFQDEGHSLSGMYGFPGFDILELRQGVDEILLEDPDAVFLISSGTDAAMLAQFLRNDSFSGLIMGSQWTRTNDLITQGGRSVEGMYVVGPYYPSIESKDFESFKGVYLDRFSLPPDFSAVSSYEATRALLQVIGEVEHPESKTVREAMINRTFSGFRGDISIDRFGDTTRALGYAIIENGRFVNYRYESP
jgi:branched-chain amino acid transport system substrate-binding protein